MIRRWFGILKDISRQNHDQNFISYLERNMVIYGVVKTLFGAAMVMGFYGLDVSLGLERLKELLLLRSITASLLLLNIALFFYRPSATKNRVQMIVAYYILVFYSPVLTYLAGGFQSSYWAGMNFILIFWLGLAPFNFFKTIGHACVFVMIYNGILFSLCWPVVDSVKLIEYNIFLLGTFAIGGVITYFNNYNAYKVFTANVELNAEREKSESLLLSILPREIAHRLKVERGIIANKYEHVTVLFSDLVGFTSLSESLEPERLVQILNEIFSKFDLLTEKHDLEKIKTIGDAYMVVGGAPVESADHTIRILNFAIEMNEAMKEISSRYGEKLVLRIGIHSGPVIAGVIGSKKFAYDLWGDTVNTASRMESHGAPGRIHVTERVYTNARDLFRFEDRGVREVKGKGLMRTFFIQANVPVLNSPVEV